MGVAAVTAGLRITTSDRDILMLGTGSPDPHVVAVDRQEANKDHLDDAIALLTKTWRHDELAIF